MTWYRKEDPTPFDDLPLEGLHFLHGDIVAVLLKAAWVTGQKYPLLEFPGGHACDIWEGNTSPIIHIYGEMDLPLHDTRDVALRRATRIAEDCGYLVKAVGDDKLELWGQDLDEHFLLTYDNEAAQLIDVAQLPAETDTPPRPPLLDEKSRAKLPPLKSQEHLGWNAIAQVKFFTPDSNFTWYASEFDGSAEFFGLVAGQAIELGAFSLAELESVRGPLGLPVERDRWFTPKTLGELKRIHEGGGTG